MASKQADSLDGNTDFIRLEQKPTDAMLKMGVKK